MLFTANAVPGPGVLYPQKAPGSAHSYSTGCRMGVSEEVVSSLRICGHGVVGEASPTNHVPGTTCSACVHIKLHRFVYILFLDK